MLAESDILRRREIRAARGERYSRESLDRIESLMEKPEEAKPNDVRFATMVALAGKDWIAQKEAAQLLGYLGRDSVLHKIAGLPEVHKGVRDVADVFLGNRPKAVLAFELEHNPRYNTNPFGQYDHDLTSGAKAVVADLRYNARIRVENEGVKSGTIDQLTHVVDLGPTVGLSAAQLENLGIIERHDKLLPSTYGMVQLKKGDKEANARAWNISVPGSGISLTEDVAKKLGINGLGEEVEIKRI